MSVFLSMATIPCSSSSSDNIGTFRRSSSFLLQTTIQNLSATPKTLSFLSTAAKKPSPSAFSTILSFNQGKRLHIEKSAVRAAAAAAAVEAAQEDSTSATSSQESQIEDAQKLRVVVKPMEKPRLVLKFIWLEKNIGLALDQVIPGHGTIPLSPYYFWPRKDAWEELKTKLESKPWISQKRMIILLNQATDIINLWQQSGGNI